MKENQILARLQRAYKEGNRVKVRFYKRKLSELLGVK